MKGFRFSLTSLIAFVTSSMVEGFVADYHGTMKKPRTFLPSSLRMAPSDSPAGSFFNPVPNDDDDEEEEEDKVENEDSKETPKDIDDQIVELLRQRRKPSHASRPSTIGGVPTSKASGTTRNRFDSLPEPPLVHDS